MELLYTCTDLQAEWVWTVVQELEDRYNRLRLEVQLAADKGEAASEADLIRRAMAKEKSAPPVKGFFAKYVSCICVCALYM